MEPWDDDDDDELINDDVMMMDEPPLPPEMDIPSEDEEQQDEEPQQEPELHPLPVQQQDAPLVVASPPLRKILKTKTLSPTDPFTFERYVNLSHSLTVSYHSLAVTRLHRDGVSHPQTKSNNNNNNAARWVFVYVFNALRHKMNTIYCKTKQLVMQYVGW